MTQPMVSAEYSLYSEKIENVVSLTHAEVSKQPEWNYYLVVKKLAMSSPLTANKNRVSELSRLENNWDGYGAVSPDRNVIKNSFRFLDVLAKEGIVDIEPDDIYPMPYGSVVIELVRKEGLISIEVGKHKLGFFTEYKSQKDMSSSGEGSDFRSIPETLRKAIRILEYGG